MTPSVERSDGADDGFILRCKYDIGIQTVPVNAETEPVAVATISCEFGALYNLDQLGDQGPTDDEFEAFSQTIGQLSLWPYAREFMQSATSRLGIPTLTLGMFRVGMSQEEAGVPAVE